MKVESELNEDIAAALWTGGFLDEIRDVVIVCDLEYSVMHINMSAERLYDCPAGAAAGMHLADVLRQEAAGQVFQAACERVRADGSWHGTMRHMNRGGTGFDVEMRWRPATDKDGRHSIVIVGSDVTRFNKLQADFLEAKQMEAVAIRATSVAHTMSDMLSAALLGLDQMEQAPHAHHHQLIVDLKGRLQRCARLVCRLLSLETKVPGSEVTSSEDLPELLEGSARSIFPPTVRREVVIENDLRPLRADSWQLQKVLLTLCVRLNAFLSPGDQIRFGASNEELDGPYAALIGVPEPGPYVKITVLPAFRRDGHSIRELGEETSGSPGNISEAISKLGGAFRVQASERGHGQCEIYVPAHLAAREGGRERTCVSKGKGEVIMVVDDEAPIRQLTRMTLENHGYRVVTASDGAEAVALYAQQVEKIALIIIDVMMPHMRGDKAIRTILQINPKARIVATSGYMSQESVPTGADGRVAFLRKPYDTEILLSTLQNVLAGSGAMTQTIRRGA